MDIRILEYFLAVAREESISAAAKSLHMTQPPLSRQLMNLEDELGVALLVRGNRKITLTEEGLLLRKRAEEIVSLFKKTKVEVNTYNKEMSGDIYIGGGETEGMRIVAKIIHDLRKQYPNIHIHLYSGNAENVIERIDRGLLDFGILVGSADISKYDFIRLPATDVWGLLMRKNDPLAEKASIVSTDLNGLPIISSIQSLVSNELSGWLGQDYETLNIIATYNLLFNASLLVEEGCGYALCLDKIIKENQNGLLCFRPLEPPLEIGMNIIWKKYNVFTKASELFLSKLKTLKPVDELQHSIDLFA